LAKVGWIRGVVMVVVVHEDLCWMSILLFYLLSPVGVRLDWMLLYLLITCCQQLVNLFWTERLNLLHIMSGNRCWDWKLSF
jgi:hypothetical protein